MAIIIINFEFGTDRVEVGDERNQYITGIKTPQFKATWKNPATAKMFTILFSIKSTLNPE